MPKLKAPLLSLGAHGTLADTLTFQKRAGGTMARQKPTPTYRRTLPQAYQRWLYEDYVAYWNDQSAATKQTWETNARPYHMTGFAYWMKYHLTNLPDIAAWWRLDKLPGSTAIDFSKNLNHGTIYGPLYVPGQIGDCLSFDGIDDYLEIPSSPSLNITGSISIEFDLYPHSFPGRQQIYDKRLLLQYWSFINTGGTYVRFSINNGGVEKWILGSAIAADLWYHIVYTFNAITHIAKVFYNGDLDADKDLGVAAIDTGTGTLILGNFQPAPDRNIDALIDNFIIYNRVLTPSDIKRHSERRYP